MRPTLQAIMGPIPNNNINNNININISNNNNKQPGTSSPAYLTVQLWFFSCKCKPINHRWSPPQYTGFFSWYCCKISVGASTPSLSLAPQQNHKIPNKGKVLTKLTVSTEILDVKLLIKYIIFYYNII